MISLFFKPFYKDTFDWTELEFIRNVRSHPRIRKFTFQSKAVTRVEQHDWFENVYSKDPNYQIYLIYNENNDAKIGYMKFYMNSLIHKRAEISCFVHPHFQNAKLEQSAILWLISSTKNIEEIHSFWTKFLYSDNYRWLLFNKCGFKNRGILKDYVYKDNQYKDVCIMSLNIS